MKGRERAHSLSASILDATRGTLLQVFRFWQFYEEFIKLVSKCLYNGMLPVHPPWKLFISFSPNSNVSAFSRNQPLTLSNSNRIKFDVLLFLSTIRKNCLIRKKVRRYGFPVSVCARFCTLGNEKNAKRLVAPGERICVCMHVYSVQHVGRRLLPPCARILRWLQVVHFVLFALLLLLRWRRRLGWGQRWHRRPRNSKFETLRSQIDFAWSITRQTTSACV